MKYIDAEKLKELINEKWKELADKNTKVGGGEWDSEIYAYLSVLSLINSLQQKQVGVEKTIAEKFARIIRANLIGIDKNVQYKFEQLYKEITGEKMYKGYND